MVEMSRLSSALVAVSRGLGMSGRTGRDVRSLKARNAQLESELTAVRAQLTDAMAWLKRADPLWQWEKRGKLTYDADGLATWDHIVDFLDDPHFMAAYNDAVASWVRQAPPEARAHELRFEWRVAIGCWAAWHAKHLVGDFVECGVNTGVMSQAVCAYIDFNATGKKFFLFDTYQGIPLSQASEDEKAPASKLNSLYYRDHYASAVDNFRRFPNVNLIRGEVPGSLRGVPIDKVAYLHLDMNIAYPEVEALKYFWPKMTTGGIVLFDDFGFHPVQNDALDDLALSLGLKIGLLPTGQGLLIKP